MSQTVKGVVTTDGVVSIDYESLANLPTINGVEIKGDVYLDIDTAMYYPSLSVAINDLNNDDWKSIVPKEQAKVACFYSDKGENVIQLLDDVSVGGILQIKRQVSLILDGHTINLDAAGWLNFSAGKSAIWAQKEGSKVSKEGFESSATTRMIAFTCEHMEIHGGTYRLSGTCICPTAEQEAANKTILAQVFVGGTNNQFGLLDNCTVEAEVYFAENGGVKDWHTIAIQNSGKNTIINGGSWNVKTTGKSVARIAMNGGKLTVENANFVAESIDSSAIAFENDKTPNLGELDIKNCSISATTAAESAKKAGAIANPWSGNICRISDSIAFTDSKDFDPHEDGLGTYAIAIDNAEGAVCYVTNVIAHGTHGCMANRGKMYVNGGRYTGFCHGGIYCSHGAEGEAFINDAYLRDGYYEGSYTTQYLQYEAQGACVGGSYIGGGPEEYCSNITAYFDGCTIEGKTNALVMRGGDDANHGEKNNTAYLSNCNIIYGSGSWGVAIGDTTHSVYLGTNCNYNKEESNQPDCITYTNALYRKKIDDADLNTLVDYANKTAEDARVVLVNLTATEEEGVYTIDRSYEEVVAAIDAGRTVVAVLDGTRHNYLFEEGGELVFTANVADYMSAIFITSENGAVADSFPLASADQIPTKVSQLENDSGYITSADTQTLYVNITTNNDGTYTADKSYEEIQAAVLQNRSVIAVMEGMYHPLVGIVDDAAVFLLYSMDQALQINIDQSGTVEITMDDGVQSVNGKTGEVILTAEDVGALPDTTTIPTVPDTLPNPSALTINGITYNGATAVDMTDIINALIDSKLGVIENGSY